MVLAGITKRKLTWRDVLSHYLFVIMLVLFTDSYIQENRAQAAA